MLCRQEIIREKRKVVAETLEGQAKVESSGHRLDRASEESLARHATLQDLPIYVRLLEEERTLDELTLGLTMIRQLLQSTILPLPIEPIIESRILPRLVQLFQERIVVPVCFSITEPQLEERYLLPLSSRLDLAWIFTNLAVERTEHLRILEKRGVLDCLLETILNPSKSFPSNELVGEDPLLASQCIWATSNFAADKDFKYRDLILTYRDSMIIQRLCTFLRMQTTESLYTESLTLLSILLSSDPAPQLYLIEEAVQTFGAILGSLNRESSKERFAALLNSNFHSQHLARVLQSFESLFRIYVVKIQEVAHAYGLHEVLVKLMDQAHNPLLSSMAGRLIGLLCFQFDTEPQYFVKCGLLEAIKSRLEEETDDEMPLNLCWMVSNLKQRYVDVAQLMIDKGLVSTLMNTYYAAEEIYLKYEALYALTFHFRGSSMQQFKVLLTDYHLLSLLVDALKHVSQQGLLC